MEDKSKILDKIKKLFKLSESTNVNEATLALAKAKELLDKYELSVEEVKLSEVSEVVGNKYANVKAPEYMIALLSSIAQLFKCEVYQTTTYISYHKSVVSPVFIGISPNSEIASYCFGVLSKKLEISRKEFVSKLNSRTKRANKTKRGDEYALGWVYGVHTSVIKLVPERAVPELVETYYRKKVEDMSEAKVKKVKVSSRSTPESLKKGYADGEKVELLTPVNGVKETALIA